MGAAEALGMTQAEFDKLVGYAKGANEQLAQTGTVNGATPNQNLAAVANQKGNTSGAVATPYITPNGTTDYHITGGSYVAPQTTPTKVDAPATGVSGVSTSTPSISSGDSGAINAQNYINQLNDLRKNAALAALGKSHDAALSNLGNEKSAIQPKYYDQRNQVAAGAQQQARNFSEYMANRGGSSSGANAQATLSNNMTTQGNLGTLGRQEAQAYTDIERRTTDVNNAYESDVASATANAEADKMQALLQDYYQAQSRNDTKAQQDIQNKIQQAQLELQQAGQKADYTGNYNGQQTQQSKQLDRSNFESDRSYNLAKSTQDWTQTFQKEQYTDQKAQQLWENTFKDKSFTQSMNDAAASRGLQWASLNQRDKEFVADQAFKEKAFTADQEQRTTDNTLNQNKFDWDKNPLNPANAGKAQSGNFNLDDYKGYVNQNFYKDVPADPNKPWENKTIKQLDVGATERYILSQPITNDQKAQLYKLYGIPMK